MNKIAIYILLIICYLGMAKSFSPTELGVAFIKEPKDIANLVNGSPATVVLTDIHTTGFIIKTYYIKLKIIYAYSGAQEVVVRSTKDFSLGQKEFIGMSIYRRNDVDESENYTPLPPGTIFVGDPALGRWRIRKSGQKYWSFFRSYRYLPNLLGWENFRPDINFSNKASAYIGQNKPFFGLNGEFGTNGEITKKSFPDFFDQSRTKNMSFKKLMLDYIKENFYHKL